jgi:hypothetical protein
MENRIGLATTSRTDSTEADEALRRGCTDRVAYPTEPLSAVAAAALHRLERAFTPSINPDSTHDEALRRVVAEQIGPRQSGVVYYDGSRLVQVRRVIADLAEARRVLRRRAAQFAIEVVDLHTGDQHYTGAVWTGSDRVLKAVA